MASISRNLIKLCEEIEFEDGVGTPSGRPASSRSGRSGMSGMNSPLPADDYDMGMDDMSDMPMGNDPLDMPMTDTDIDVTDSGDGANITIATPKGTSVTVTEARRRKLREARKRRSMREGFFKTNADIENLYKGDDALSVFDKRDKAKWMCENDEGGEAVETEEEVTMSSTSGKDGRHVSGTVSDANGKSYDIDGTLSFSGDDLLIDDVNLDAVSSSGSGSEMEETEEVDTTEETSETGLEKNPDADITFEEKFGRKNENNNSLIAKMKDPIGDMLNLRKSSVDSPFAGKPHHGPVKRVHDNSLQNRKEVDIKKGNPSQTDTKAPRYQTKTASE